MIYALPEVANRAAKCKQCGQQGEVEKGRGGGKGGERQSGRKREKEEEGTGAEAVLAGICK